MLVTYKYFLIKVHSHWDEVEDGRVDIPVVPNDKISTDIFAKSLHLGRLELLETVLMGADSIGSSNHFNSQLEFNCILN